MGRLINWIKEKWENNKTGFMIVTLIGILLFAFIAYEGVHLTCSATFCNICHSMKPAVKTWRQSSHSDPAKHHLFENCMPL